MSYTPYKGRTTKELQYYLSVCRKNGYHCAFPYGWSLPNPRAYIYETLRQPVYHGWTLRVFFYAVNKNIGKSQVQISLDAIQQASNFIAVEATPGGSIQTHGQAQGWQFSERFLRTIKQGDHFSIGVQVDTSISNFRGVFNEHTEDTQHLQYVNDLSRWLYKITADTNIITSIHVYDDLERNFPRDGLGNEFLLTTVPLPIASYGIFNVIFSGNQQFLSIKFKDKDEDRNMNYYNIGVGAGRVFSLHIRNAPTGWLVQPSFTKNADLLARKYADNGISPIFRYGVIARIYMESSVGS